MPSDAEIMTQSPSQTVSIYEALAEILSKPTESLSLTNSKSTDRTLFSEAPSTTTSRTTTTSTTTSTTTPLPPPTTEANDDAKVENSSLEGLESVQSVNTTTTRVNKRISSASAGQSSTVTFEADDLTTTTAFPSQLPQLPQTTTVNTLRDSQTHSMTTLDEFSTPLSTTLTDLTQNLTELEAFLTNNLTDFDNETNASNHTEIETIQINLLRERNHVADMKTDSPRAIDATSTVPPSYRPRFTSANRIPILSREDRSDEATTKATVIDLMTFRVTKKDEKPALYSTPSVFPVYRPELETTTKMMSTSALTQKPPTEATSESADATETIVTSSYMTLTESEPTTASSIGDLESLNDAATSTSPRQSTLSFSFINEINELQTTTETMDAVASSTPREKLTTESSQRDFNGESTETTSESQPSSTSELSPTETSTPLRVQLKLPKSLLPRPFQPASSSAPPNVVERVAYAILPNNTVVRKIIQLRLTTENPYVIYGILPNQSVVRRFRNGSLVPDESSTRIEITNIDPQSLTNPNSEFHQMLAASTLPITEQTKTVFHLLILTKLASSRRLLHIEILDLPLRFLDGGKCCLDFNRLCSARFLSLTV